MVRANYERGKCNDVFQKKVLGLLNEIKDDMKKYSFHMQMDSTDLSEFFPLKNKHDLAKFMDRDHEEWPLRRRGFYHLLFTTVSQTKKKFASGLLHTLFSRNFIKEHKWPYYGY